MDALGLILSAALSNSENIKLLSLKTTQTSIITPVNSTATAYGEYIEIPNAPNDASTIWILYSVTRSSSGSSSSTLHSFCDIVFGDPYNICHYSILSCCRENVTVIDMQYIGYGNGSVHIELIMRSGKLCFRASWHGTNTTTGNSIVVQPCPFLCIAFYD